MISSSGECSSDSRPRLVTVAVAAAGLLLCLSAAGCTPEPTEQGAPGTPTQESPSPSSTAAPSAPVSDGPTADDGTAPATPEDTDAPGNTDAPDGDDDSSGEDEGVPESVVNATGDWREPEDPTAEGPTAAPALPEVEGQIGDGVALPTEVVVSVASITTTSLTAATPGEYTGPAVVVDVQITNESDTAQPVGSAVVALIAADGEVGVPTWASPNDPLQGEVPAGATVDGTYVFMMDPAGERSVAVRVNYAAGAPVATFTGTTP